MLICKTMKLMTQYMLKHNGEEGGETLPATSQRGKSPKAGKGVGRKPGRKTKPIAVRIPVDRLESNPEIDGDWIREAVRLRLCVDDL